MTPRVRASLLLAVGAFVLYGQRLGSSLGVERLGWGLPVIHPDCSYHLSTCLWAAFTESESYWNPLPQVGLNLFTSLMPQFTWSYLLQLGAIILLVCNATILMSLLHRLSHRLDLAFALTGVFVLHPLHWPMTQWAQMLPGEFALFFGLASCLYLLAAHQHDSGKGTRILMATICFILGLGFHPASLAFLLVPLSALIWQTKLRDLLWPLLTASLWVVIAAAWWSAGDMKVSPGLEIGALAQQATLINFPAVGALTLWGVLLLAMAIASIWRRDRFLMSVGALLLSLPFLFIAAMPDPLLILGEAPPIYVIILVVVQLLALARVLAPLPSRWMRLPVPALMVGIAVSQQIPLTAGESPQYVLAPSLRSLFSEAGVEQWAALSEKHPGVWQLVWLHGKHAPADELKRELFERAQQLSPGSPLPVLSLLRSLIAAKQHPQAASLSEQALGRFASNQRWRHTFLGYHGLAQARLGNWREGLHEMQQSLPWLATDRQVLGEMARTYHKLGDRKNAMRVAIRLRRLDM